VTVRMQLYGYENSSIRAYRQRLEHTSYQPLFLKERYITCTEI